MSLSVCLIVRDEEEVIARCLGCVADFADEIIVVDTGSADGTVNCSRAFTDKVFFFEWKDDFSAARNFAFDKATCDYVMWLDADDIVTEDNRRKIKRLVSAADFDIVFLPYAVAFEEDEPTFIYYRERIFRRSGNYRFCGAVHEAVAPRGKQIYSDAAIYHKKVKEGDPFRNLGIYQKQIARGICLDERSLFYYGRELYFNKMYRECIAVLEGFLSGDGWEVNKAEACVNLYGAYTALGDKKSALNALTNSFLYSAPRSDACCLLGAFFMEENAASRAIYWYQRALECNDDGKNGGFVNLDYCGFIPNMQLCVLYDKLGDKEKAQSYNEAAGKLKPHNKNYLYNKKYFQTLSGKEV